jgi:hypothetical protein
MRPALEVRSLIIGLLLGMLVVIGIGAAQAIPDGVRPVVDRFQIEAGDGGAVYVLDTATGQVWTVGQAGFASPKLNQGQ